MIHYFAIYQSPSERDAVVLAERDRKLEAAREQRRQRRQEQQLAA
jgi:hypothetical protein